MDGWEISCLSDNLGPTKFYFFWIQKMVGRPKFESFAMDA